MQDIDQTLAMDPTRQVEGRRGNSVAEDGIEHGLPGALLALVLCRVEVEGHLGPVDGLTVRVL